MNADYVENLEHERDLLARLIEERGDMYGAHWGVPGVIMLRRTVHGRWQRYHNDGTLLPQTYGSVLEAIRVRL